MEPRERLHGERPRSPGSSGDNASHEALDAARTAGEQFLAAGDEAIRRALSGDSEAFLRANRQRGGE